MKNIIIENRNVEFIYESEWDEIINLHKSIYRFNNELIRKSICSKDELYIFKNKRNNSIVATISVKFIEENDCVVVYFGNAAIVKNYRNKGFTCKCIINSDKKARRLWPNKTIFWSGLALTPISYRFAFLCSKSWPRLGLPTPHDKFNLMNAILENHLKLNCIRIKDVGVVTDELCPHLSSELDFKINKKHNHIVTYFENLNPNWRKGTELLMLSESSAIDRIALKAFNHYKELKHWANEPWHEELAA